MNKKGPIIQSVPDRDAPVMSPYCQFWPEGHRIVASQDPIDGRPSGRGEPGSF